MPILAWNRGDLRRKRFSTPAPVPWVSARGEGGKQAAPCSVLLFLDKIGYFWQPFQATSCIAIFRQNMLVLVTRPGHLVGVSSGPLRLHRGGSLDEMAVRPFLRPALCGVVILRTRVGEG